LSHQIHSAEDCDGVWWVRRLDRSRNHASVDTFYPICGLRVMLHRCAVQLEPCSMGNVIVVQSPRSSTADETGNRCMKYGYYKAVCRAESVEPLQISRDSIKIVTTNARELNDRKTLRISALTTSKPNSRKRRGALIRMIRD
jgi:hypothetical protein